MNYSIANIFSSQLVTAICHTLAHSLWQGALLSAITGAIMASTRKSSSALRYNLLVSAMVLFAVTVAGTFYFEFNNGDTHTVLSANDPVVTAAPVPHETINYQAAPASSITETIGSYLNKYAVIIVWAWLLIVYVRCVQLATGLREVYRLRHKNISSIDSYWKERVQQLCGQLGITRVIDIAQSGLAKTPMVTGHLKPLILVPLGMLTSLSAEEIEAVLLHELAHIRRSDYLVNLLQNMMEIVFFFNPAVLWLSALIKAERENCCDDIAVARSGKLNYVKALVACEEYKMQPLTYAMALHTRNHSLKNRVGRIISNRNQSLNRGEKSLLAVCLIAVGIFTMVFANGGKAGAQAMPAQKSATIKPKADIVLGPNDGAELVQKVTDTTKKHITAVLAGGDLANGQKADEIKRESDSERTAGIIEDMMKDGIITTTTGLSFKIGTDEFVVNYQKQPDVVYQKYRGKYVSTQYHGPNDWIWYYQFDSQRWAVMVAHKYIDTQPRDTTTGVFKGKLN